MRGNWKKGALHCHTLWSDGNTLPETAIKMFMDEGYDFVCLSDHNILPEANDVWLPVRPEAGRWPQDLSVKEYERSKKLLPEGCIEEKDISYRKFVRLKPYSQLKKEWEKEGEFLLVPGTEITTGGENFNKEGRIHAIHYNTFNLVKDFPVPTGGDALGLTDKALALYNEAKQDNSFFMVNHPFYVMWDTDPRVLIQRDEIEFFEHNNSDSSPVPENWIYERERYWDFVLAHRLSQGKRMLYGTSTSDSHFYDPESKGKSGYFDTGFVMVNCEKDFTIDHIVESMKKGEFYSSTGVLFDEISFDKEKGTLYVKVEKEEGLDYRLDFFVTKKNFNKSMVIKEFPFEKTPAFSRTLPLMPDDVGVIAKSCNGIEASYTLMEDDLYVRCVVTSSRKGRLEKSTLYPEFETAWTQPYTL